MKTENATHMTVWVNPHPLRLTEKEVDWLGLLIFPKVPTKTDKPYDLSVAARDSILAQEKDGTLENNIATFITGSNFFNETSFSYAQSYLHEKLQKIKESGLDIVAPVTKDKTSCLIFETMGDNNPEYYIHLGRNQRQMVRRHYRND